MDRARAAAPLTAAGLCLALAACGSTAHTAAGTGPTTTAEPAAAFAAAYSSTVGAKTARIALALHEEAAGQQVTATGAGAFDWATSQGTLSLTISPTGGQSSELSEVLTPGTVYVELPAQVRQAAGVGTPWVAIPHSAGAANALTSSPEQILATLLESSSSVQEVGPATVDGVPTTEYSARIDPSKAAARLPPALQQKAQQALARSGIGPIPVHVWVDHGGRLVRMTEALSSPGGGTPAVSADVQLDLSDYGTPVTATAPPADQVGSAGALGSILGGGPGGPAGTSPAPTSAP